MIEKTASRIFQEMSLIEKLLNKSIDNYNPTGDDRLDGTPSATTCRPGPTAL